MDTPRRALNGGNAPRAPCQPHVHQGVRADTNKPMSWQTSSRGGPVRKLLTVCLCGCCPGRLVSFVFDGGFAAEAGVDAAGVVEVFDPGGDPGVDLVAGGEGAPVVVLGCEGGPQDWVMALSQHTPARPIDTVPFTARM